MHVNYRAFHSTETALLKIQNGIATFMDNCSAVGLVLPDYMQTIHKFTWNLTLGTLILAPLNWQTDLRQSRRGWEITNLN